MFAIAITDDDWFSNVRSLSYPAANFWTPTPWAIRKLAVGDRWYFMRKSPTRLIGGYGHFVRYSEMTMRDTWNTFGTRNGINNDRDFFAKITSIASKRSTNFVANKHNTIGCIELSNIFTASDVNHLDLTTTSLNFPRQIVKFKYFEGPDELERHF